MSEFSYDFPMGFNRKYYVLYNTVCCLTSTTYGIWLAKHLKWLVEYKINWGGGYFDKAGIEAARLEGLRQLYNNNEVEGKSAICIDQATTNYYHLVCNILPDIVAINNSIELNNIIVANESKMLKEYLQLLGIEMKLISARGKGISIKESVLGISYPPTDSKYNHGSVCLEIKHQIEKKMSTTEATYPRKIFIERKSSNNGSQMRAVYPRELIHKDLIKNGYTIVYLEDLRIIEQIRLFASADCIIAVHGAALTNIMYAQANSRIREIVHVNGSPSCFKDLATRLRLANYRQVFCPGLLSDAEEEMLKQRTGNLSNNVCPLKYTYQLKEELFSS